MMLTRTYSFPFGFPGGTFLLGEAELEDSVVYKALHFFVVLSDSEIYLTKTEYSVIIIEVSFFTINNNMYMLKKILGIAPTKEGKGYIPSPLGRLLGVDKVTGYTPAQFNKKYTGEKKILVLCTQEKYFKMTNGRLFSTGNNVQETAVPLMHLVSAGFDFEVVTPTGSQAILEDWSTPTRDENVIKFMKKYKNKFDTPLSLEHMIASKKLHNESPFIAVFIPGGHGSMVGLPEDEKVGQLIRWVQATDRYMVAVCHGPAALMAASLNQEEHPYKGYSMAIFPDSYDKQSPSIGYLPGHLPWYQCEELAKQGLSFVNDKIKGYVHVDRKLYTGDSPKACDELGKKIAKTLLKEFGNA